MALSVHAFPGLKIQTWGTRRNSRKAKEGPGLKAALFGPIFRGLESTVPSARANLQLHYPGQSSLPDSARECMIW
jgi:hypothetical protein